MTETTEEYRERLMEFAGSISESTLEHLLSRIPKKYSNDECYYIVAAVCGLIIGSGAPDEQTLKRMVALALQTAKESHATKAALKAMH
jgi:hypothetical protein